MPYSQVRDLLLIHSIVKDMEAKAMDKKVNTNMADLDRDIKQMQQLKRETLDFNAAIADVFSSDYGFYQAGSRLTGSGTRAGTVWSLISRLSVGTGFHRVEANIRFYHFHS